MRCNRRTFDDGQTIPHWGGTGMHRNEDGQTSSYLRGEAVLIGVLMVVLVVLVWRAFTTTDETAPEADRTGIVGVDEPPGDDNATTTATTPATTTATTPATTPAP